MRSLRSVLAVAAVVVGTPILVVAQVAKPSMAPPSTSAKGIQEKGLSNISVGILTGGDGNQGTGVGAQFEYGLLNLSSNVMLGVGGSLGYTRKSVAGFSYTALPVYGIANAHFVLPDQPNVDLYAGASVGFTRFNVPSVTVGGIRTGGGSATNSGFGIQGGGRYKISDKLSVHAQIGLIDIPLLHAGITFKL
jgi:Outer membrane protein beta-barrel domain